MTPTSRATTLAPAFSVAQGRVAGRTRSEMAASTLDRPFHGVRSIRAFDPDTGAARDSHLALTQAYATVMTPGQFFSHRTAAVLWGLPLPSLRPWADGPVDVAVFTPQRHARGRGVRGHEVGTRLATVVDHPEHGFRVASPASTWAMLGAVLRHPYDLVAVGDAVTRAPQHPDDPAALATLAQLAAAAHAGRRVGVGALRGALPLVRTGASSRPETWTRLTIVDAGLPEPELAHEAFDRRGRFIGRIDLAYPALKIAIEYEGEHHLTDPEQWSRDILRYERLAAEGWTVIRVTKDELFDHPLSLVARIRKALALADA